MHSLIVLFLVLFTIGQSSYDDDRGPLVEEQNGKMELVEDFLGDRIPDFSWVGYHHSSRPLPHVETKIILEPSPYRDDDTQRIQEAINQLSLSKPNEWGHRGALLLKAGAYWVDGQLTIRKSGIVLRGEGQGQEGTIIVARGTDKRYLLDIKGDIHEQPGVSEIEGTRTPIVEKRVPAGSRRIRVENGDKFTIGDQIIVHRAVNEAWISLLGMDQFTPPETTPWTPEFYSFNWYRKVMDISGDTIVIDAPTVLAIDQDFGGGWIARGDSRNMIEEIGVENIRFVSDFEYHPSLRDHDENHSEGAISMNNVRNSWIRNVTGVHFSMSTVRLEEETQQITVMDNANLDMVSKIIGGRRSPFFSRGQQNLFIRNYSETGRHCFNFSRQNRGPNVVVDSRSEQAYNLTETHTRFSHGVLYDNVLIYGENDRVGLMVANRGDSGTGHGWTGAWTIFWNSGSKFMGVMDPPTARNMIIGYRPTEKDEKAILYRSSWLAGRNEWFDVPYNLKLSRHEVQDILYLHRHSVVHPEGPVEPRSLFIEQLRSRLGDEAVEAITIPAQRNGDMEALTAYLKQLGERTSQEIISVNTEKFEELPEDMFRLYENYPNPFNPTTKLVFELNEHSHVTLELFNAMGQIVKMMDLGEYTVGRYEIVLDANNLSSGIYMVRMQAGSQVQTLPVTLIK